MSANWIVLAMMPVTFFFVLVLECSRLYCTRIVQRRLGGESAARATNASGEPRFG